MNTQNDFLDNAVDDELAIGMTEDLNAEMCSYMQSDTEIMCSSLRSDTCGNNLLPCPHKIRIFWRITVLKRWFCHRFATHIFKICLDSRNGAERFELNAVQCHFILFGIV